MRRRKVIPGDNDLQYAKGVALRYLSRASRSVKEVERKLKEKGIPDRVRKEVIDYLISFGYLNDAIFAREWTAAKIRSRFWGKIRIIHELRKKGISEEIRKDVIDALAQDTEELETAKRAFAKWMRTKKKAGAERKGNSHAAAYKAARYLLSKGFSPSIIAMVLREQDGAIELHEGE